MHAWCGGAVFAPGHQKLERCCNNDNEKLCVVIEQRFLNWDPRFKGSVQVKWKCNTNHLFFVEK